MSIKQKVRGKLEEIEDKLIIGVAGTNV